MTRPRLIFGALAVLFAVLAPNAQAASPYARATLVGCDREVREAVFDGRITAYKRAPRMQMRFTLQVQTPDDQRWRKIDAPGWGEWISAPQNLGKYTYTRTVQELLAPANYRAVVNFRWRDRRGKTIRSERATSPVCRQPDARADLLVRNVRLTDGQYVATIFNRGREAAGAFTVNFVVDGTPLDTVQVAGLAPHTPVTVMLPAPARCLAGTPIEAVADAGAQVDEADEENNSLYGVC